MGKPSSSFTVREKHVDLARFACIPFVSVRVCDRFCGGCAGMASAVYIKGVAVTNYKRFAVSDDDKWCSKYSKLYLRVRLFFFSRMPYNFDTTLK
ncbi:hypothetical protein Scep_012552 [Stephania cephalantha]|uniref:Uncharacterized protein n=1 Tax=Stephania cephalantha TaxID=152367 RepID=A0AAP0JFJ6_9MAGN